MVSLMMVASYPVSSFSLATLSAPITSNLSARMPTTSRHTLVTVSEALFSMVDVLDPVVPTLRHTVGVVKPPIELLRLLTSPFKPIGDELQHILAGVEPVAGVIEAVVAPFGACLDRTRLRLPTRSPIGSMLTSRLLLLSSACEALEHEYVDKYYACRYLA